MINSQKGFTLIELIVVITILGVVLMVAVTSIHFLNAERELKLKATEIKLALETATQEAILLPAILGVKFDANGYQFFRYEKGEWKRLKHDNLSHSKAFVNSIQPKFTLANHATLLMISMTGEIQPFTLDLTDKHHSAAYRLTLNQDGQIGLINKTRHSNE